MAVVNTVHRFTAEGAFPHWPTMEGSSSVLVSPSRTSVDVRSRERDAGLRFPVCRPVRPRSHAAFRSARHPMVPAGHTTHEHARGLPILACASDGPLPAGWSFVGEERLLPPPTLLHVLPVTRMVPTIERPSSPRRPRLAPRAHPQVRGYRPLRHGSEHLPPLTETSSRLAPAASCEAVASPLPRLGVGRPTRQGRSRRWSGFCDR